MLIFVHTAEGAQLHTGVYFNDLKFRFQQDKLELLRPGKVDALVRFALVFSFLSFQFKAVTEAIHNLQIRSDKTNVFRLERDLTWTEHDIAPALHQMQIGAAQRAAQLERRDLKIIAVDGSRKILEACAAAVELSDRDRRYQWDARVRLDVEPQLVRNQRAVLF